MDYDLDELLCKINQFEEIAKRWGKSERQISRIAAKGEQRDIDAVNGLPENK